jgi:hypothetical protein
MGLLTFTQIKTEISAHHGGRADITSRLNTVVDLAQMRMARLKDWDGLKLLIRGTLNYGGTAQVDKVYDLSSELPTNYLLKQIYSIRILSSDGRSKKLVGKVQSEFDKMVPEPEYYARGFPEIYVRTATKSGSTYIKQGIELWRVPDEAYSIEVRAQTWPGYLTNSGKATTDASDLDLDDALIHLSTSYLYNSFGREDKARFHFAIYKDIINDAEKLEDEDFDTVIAGVSVSQGVMGQYWLDPFVREV